MQNVNLELMSEYCVQLAEDNGFSGDEALEAGQEFFNSFNQAGRLTGQSGLRSILGEKYPDYFCKAYIPDQFGREFGPFAIEVLRNAAAAITDTARHNEADVEPRGHGKSTKLTLGIPTWATCYRKKRFPLFISANYDTSKNFLGKNRKALESPDITEDFGPQPGPAWSAEELCTSTGIWLKCAGWKAGLRGMNKDTRPDLIILDDLEDKETMESLPMQRKLEDCFQNEIGRLGDYNTDFIYVGTLLSEDSLLAKTMLNPAWNAHVYKRVISFPERQDLWDAWRKIYCDLANPNRAEDAWKYYQVRKTLMLAGAKVLWEDKVPPGSTKYPGGYYNVMLDRVAFGEDAFWQEDQSEPAKASDKPFKQLTFWQDKYQDDAKKPDENTFRAALRNLKLVIDPAEGKGQDRTAYCLGGGINGGVGILLGELRNDGLTAIMQHAAWFLDNYPGIEEVIVEENTYKENGTEQIREYLQQHGHPVKVTGFRSETKKYNRIIAMEPDINAGLVLFNKDNTDFNMQVLRFSATAANDDAPDAVEMLRRRFKGSEGWLEYLRQEAEKARQAAEGKKSA